MIWFALYSLMWLLIISDFYIGDGYIVLEIKPLVWTLALIGIVIFGILSSYYVSTAFLIYTAVILFIVRVVLCWNNSCD